MAETEHEGFAISPGFLDSLEVGSPTHSKVTFSELGEFLEELRADLEASPREITVRITRYKSRREEPICDVFAIAGFHSVDGVLNELIHQVDSVDELGAFKLLDGTKEAIELVRQIRQGVLATAEELGVDIKVLGGRFAD